MKSFIVKILPPRNLSPESRDFAAQLLVKLAEKFGFLGMEDWSVKLDGDQKVLAVEREFHDLSGFRPTQQGFVIYFETLERASEYAKLIAMSMPELKVSRAEPAKEFDWLTRWKKFYKPVRIRATLHTPDLWILPAWKSRKTRKNELVVKIDPGQAFGTGTHPTTQLCLEYFLGGTYSVWRESKGLRVLDFGAGSGILAFATEKWGKNTGKKIQADCVEIDSIARENILKNRNLNRCQARILAKQPKSQTYDLIFANVLAPVLLEHKRELWNALKPGGVIILSGLLSSEASDFMREFFPPSKRRQFGIKYQGEWSSIWCQRPLQ